MTVVFLGPSLDVETARTVLDAQYLPPVATGDVARAVQSGARIVGVIDGYFETTPAVWHKEILWALTRGVHVLGAASMGALRAAELTPFGMRGVGMIFDLYRDGVLEDDDEVAVAHEPGGNYAAASEAMINIRCTLGNAERSGVVSNATRVQLETIAKRMFYPDRGYTTVLAAARRQGLPNREVTALEAWLPAHRIDQKRADALLLLHELRLLTTRQPTAHRPAFTLARSIFLEQLLARIATESRDRQSHP